MDNHKKLQEAAAWVVELWMREPENPKSDGLLERAVCELEELLPPELLTEVRTRLKSGN